MTYDYAKRRTAMRQNQTASAQESAARSGISNSAMLSMTGYHDEGGNSDLAAAMQAKIAALRRQIPAAEAEADSLSKGVSAQTPDTVKQEMGERLGADFSGVRFHSDAASADRAESMGAQAWTQGSDVYFGSEGFDPSVAAHELAHTVQQGAVQGTVSQSVPMGTIQMKETKEEKLQRYINTLYRIEAGQYYGGKDTEISKKDKEWFDKHIKNADKGLIVAILNRRDQAATEMLNYRNTKQPKPGETKEQLDFEARGSKGAFDMGIFNSLAAKIKDSGNKKYAESVLQYGADRKRGMTKTLTKAYDLWNDRSYNNSSENEDAVQAQNIAKKARANYIYKNYDQMVKDQQSANIQNDWVDVVDKNGQAVDRKEVERRAREEEERRRQEEERRAREEAERRAREEEERKKAEAREKVDRMFRIQAGHSFGNNASGGLSSEWYDSALGDQDEYLSNEIASRFHNSRKQMLAEREQMKKDNPGNPSKFAEDAEDMEKKLDFNAGWGDNAFNMGIYGDMIQGMRQWGKKSGFKGKLSIDKALANLEAKDEDKTVPERADKLYHDARRGLDKETDENYYQKEREEYIRAREEGYQKMNGRPISEAGRNLIESFYNNKHQISDKDMSERNFRQEKFRTRAQNIYKEEENFVQKKNHEEMMEKNKTKIEALRAQMRKYREEHPDDPRFHMLKED